MRKLLVFFLLLSAAVLAQLVVVDHQYVVSRVDRSKSQIVVTPADTDNDDTLRGHFVVLISPQTRIVDGAGRPVNWRSFRPGDGVRVQGGLTLGIKISAQTITVETPY